MMLKSIVSRSSVCGRIGIISRPSSQRISHRHLASTGHNKPTSPWLDDKSVRMKLIRGHITCYFFSRIFSVPTRGEALVFLTLICSTSTILPTYKYIHTYSCTQCWRFVVRQSSLGSGLVPIGYLRRPSPSMCLSM